MWSAIVFRTGVDRYLFSGTPLIRPWRLRAKLPVSHAPNIALLEVRATILKALHWVVAWKSKEGAPRGP
jgi:hypothetical protein